MDDQIRLLNINVGVLGHVDSGKTSLVKALSTSLSTAALDKNPQSQRRGITLDLGFSSFAMDIPEHLQDELTGKYDKIQFTLVDCPGHASLIRTIIGGAQIIDMIVLVIDINKGIQTQTAECIVIGEITTDKMIIVLNKVDMIPQEDRESKVERMMNKIKKIFSATKFIDPPIVLTAAVVGGEKVAAVAGQNPGQSTKGSKSKAGNTAASCICSGGGSGEASSTIGIPELLGVIQSRMTIPTRNLDGPFYYSIDHCFAIKGHGTVLTGTILSGTVQINSTIELPELQTQKKVKSMQMFHKPVRSALQGDRVALCVTNLDPKLIERGIATTPGTVSLVSNVICLVRKVRFFKQPCKSGGKFHVSIGHTTVTAMATFFGMEDLADVDAQIEVDREVQMQQRPAGRKNGQSTLNASFQSSFPNVCFDWEKDFEFQDELIGGASDGAVTYRQEPLQWMLLQFLSPVYCSMGSLIIASKLEADSKEVLVGSTSSCRLAFYGPLVASLPAERNLDTLRLFRWKHKDCEVHRAVDTRPADGVCFEAIGWKLYSRNASIRPFLGLKLEKEGGEVVGIIHGPFGATDKFKIRFPNGLKGVVPGMKLRLRFKRYVYDADKSMRQRGIDLPEGTPNVDLALLDVDNNQCMTADNDVAMTRSMIEGNDEISPELKVTRGDAAKRAAEQPHAIPDLRVISGGTSIESASTTKEKGARRADAVGNLGGVVGIGVHKSSQKKKEAVVAQTPLAPVAVTSSNPSNTKKGSDVSHVTGKQQHSLNKDKEKQQDQLPKEEKDSSTLATAKVKYVPLDLSSVGIKKAVTKPVKQAQPSRPNGTAAAVNRDVQSSKAKSSSEVAVPVPPPSVAAPKAATTVATVSNSTTAKLDRVYPLEANVSPTSSALRQGCVDSIKVSPTGENVAIVSGAFRMEENIRKYVGADVIQNDVIIGRLAGPFAKLGKCKVDIFREGEISPGAKVGIILSGSNT